MEALEGQIKDCKKHNTPSLTQQFNNFKRLMCEYVESNQDVRREAQ